MEQGGGAPQKFVPAVVPGAVQIDWAKAEGMPDWNWEDNFKAYRWMEDCFWVYRTRIPKTAVGAGERLVFRCGGVDYRYEVRLDGRTLYAYEGMFRPFELDLSEYADAGGALTVVIDPIPKAPDGEPDSRQEAARSCKPPVSYGWDWHPRLVPSGIWDETELTLEPAARIARAEVCYTLSEDLLTARITVDAAAAEDIVAAAAVARKSAAGKSAASTTTAAAASTPASKTAGTLRFRLFAPDGRPALETTELSETLTLQNPALWWCNGYGAPNLYRWELLLEKDGRVLDKREGTVGFRKIALTMNPGTWEEPEDFPKSRSRAPITVTLNGVPIFAKGSNWVNPEIFPGVIDETTYRPLLTCARDANMNLLRIWGGGIINKESFFDLCDAYGIMVWQEFPLACNNYPDTPEYLATLESEAAAIIRRLRGHACLAIWGGGNELFNNWSGMTDQSLPLRLLNKLCYELDRKTPFLPTSPVIGMAHGCYLFMYPDGREVYQAMAGAHYTAYTEFGVPSISNLETCLAATTREKLFPLVPNDVTIAHHAFFAWSPEDSWGGIETLRKYLGEPASLEQMIEWSQWLECEGYKCIFEEARRQKPYCSMSLNWCYNEPWPTIANNSLLNYPATPKPAYYAVAAACRNRLFSARIPRFTWRPGDVFSADLWLLNDGAEGIPAGAAEAFLEYGGERHFLLRWDHPAIPANQNLAGPTLRHLLRERQAPADGGVVDGNGATDSGADCDHCAEAAPLNGLKPPEGRGRPTELKLILSAGEMSSEYRLILYLR
jgi:beta-mannosidase